jgi:hypothetical protein
VEYLAKDLQEWQEAPRLSSLAGATGVLFNISKPRGIDFLDRLEEVLRENHAVRKIIRASKRTFTKLAPKELLADLASAADFVVLAIADCGSCNICTEYDPLGVEKKPDDGLRTCGLSMCVLEALFFESRRIPTAVVGTVEYGQAAHVQESAVGLPHYPLVIVPRSIQRLFRDEVRKIADGVTDAIVSRLTRSADTVTLTESEVYDGEAE